MLRIVLFAIVTCVVGTVIKKNCTELYLPFQIGVAVIVLAYIFNSTLDELSSFFSLVESMGASYGIIKSMLKASLITIGTKLGCDICKESGNNLLGDIIELGGKLMIFVISVPYIINIIKISAAFLK